MPLGLVLNSDYDGADGGISSAEPVRGFRQRAAALVARERPLWSTGELQSACAGCS